MGGVALAVRIYGRALNAFMFTLSFSMAQGGQIIIGHLMGAKEYDEIYKKCLKILRFATSSSVLIAIVFFIFSEQLLGIFTDSPDIMSTGRQVLFVFIFLEIGRAFNMVIIGALRAVGDVKFPVFVGMCTMWGFGLLGGFLLGVVFGLGVVGTVIGTAMDECIRGIIMYFRWRSRKWQKKGVT
jgi:Na+-driven multidrug efflux pump